jgi:hypothetical protein
MSSRGTVEGSGRSRAAEKDALAMASWWAAISILYTLYSVLFDVKLFGAGSGCDGACGEAGRNARDFSA